jgi:hypothetical protein
VVRKLLDNEAVFGIGGIGEHRAMARVEHVGPPAERIEHFFVMLGELLDAARIGGVPVRLTLSDGRVIEGIPSARMDDASGAEELDDTGYARRIRLAGERVDLTEVCEAAIVRPLAPG